MLHCDFYYPQNMGGHGDDHLYFACADIPQCGDVSMIYTPNVERTQMEDGTYAIYARGMNEKSTVLQFEGTCNDIQKIAECAKNGAFVVSGIYLDGYATSVFTGVYCYINGSPNTVTISRKIDLMSISIPVIVRDTKTGVPAACLMLDNEMAFSFGGNIIHLDSCKYIGGGQYVYEKMIDFPNAIDSACIIGTTSPIAGTPVPEFGIRESSSDEYTKSTFLPTEDTERASTFTLPVGEFECYVSIQNATSMVFKPFQIFFKCRRLSENDAV